MGSKVSLGLIVEIAVAADNGSVVAGRSARASGDDAKADVDMEDLVDDAEVDASTKRKLAVEAEASERAAACMHFASLIIAFQRLLNSQGTVQVMGLTSEEDG